jgi:hypothetical protein
LEQEGVDKLEFEFVEVGSSTFPLTIIATVVSLLAATDSALTATGTSLAATTILAAAFGPAVTDKAQTVVSNFVAASTQPRSPAWPRPVEQHAPAAGRGPHPGRRHLSRSPASGKRNPAPKTTRSAHDDRHR